MKREKKKKKKKKQRLGQQEGINDGLVCCLPQRSYTQASLQVITSINNIVHHE